MKCKWILALSLAILLILPSFAHSGRTDSSGGHWNRSTGEYHYHHGYPPHQHTDGICPYNFDDQTNHNSSGSTSTASSKRQNNEKSIKKDVQESEPVAKEKSADTNQNYDWILIALLAFLSLFIIVPIFTSIYDKYKYNKEYNKEKKHYTELYAGKSINEFVDIPSDVEIGSDGLPREKSANRSWGDQYTFYTSKSGTRFHSKYGCSGATNKIHAYNCMQSKVACARCNPHLPDMSWYKEYLKIQNIKKKYGITE